MLINTAQKMIFQSPTLVAVIILCLVAFQPPSVYADGASSTQEPVAGAPTATDSPSSEPQQKEPGNTKTKDNALSPKLQADVRDMIAQFGAVVNTKDYSTIKNFMDFYADSNARFIKDSILYDPYIPNKVVAQEKIDLLKDEFVKYITSLVVAPLEYAMVLRVKSITNPRPRLIVAEVVIEEVAISNLHDDASNPEVASINKTLSTESNIKKIKTLVTSQCNVLMRQSATMVISGMNCAEKIIIY